MTETHKGIIVCASLLAGVGVIMSLSVSVSRAETLWSDLSFLKHLLWLSAAILAALGARRLDYHRLPAFAGGLMLLAVLFLLVLLIPGVGFEYHGARRWLRWHGFGFQPSELAKVALVIFTASYLSSDASRIKSFVRGLLPTLALAALVAGLIVVEPDFGTAVLSLALAMGVLFLAGAKVSHLAPVTLGGACLMIPVMLASKYRCDRLIAFLNPWKYRQDIGYHLTQSLVAIGSGGPAGRGLGDGRQKLFFLPECGNDFIFAIIAEEGGFILAALVVALFAGLVWLGIKVACEAPDLLGYLLAAGITLALGLQALINIAVVSGLAPTKGISLPLISAGGSSLLCSLFMVGVLLNIAEQTPDEEG